VLKNFFESFVIEKLKILSRLLLNSVRGHRLWGAPNSLSYPPLD